MDAPERQIEVDFEVLAVLGQLPLPQDRVTAIREPTGEALRERFAAAPELPLALSDAHFVDAAYASCVRVELIVGAVRSVTPHDGDRVWRFGHLDSRALDHV